MSDATLQRLAHCVLDGSAMLFVGAGLSFLSKNNKGTTLPNGEQLRASLHAQTGTAKTHPLDKIANFYVKKFGTSKLYDYLTQELSVATVDKRLASLYKQPWRRIYTTNYDDAIEVARNPTRGATPFSLVDPVKEIPDGAVIHINGHIREITPQSISADLKLTDFSYATSSFENNREWSQFFRNDLRVSRAILFAGYSLADLDIARMLIAESALSTKSAFFIAPDADEVEVASLEPYGLVVPAGIERLFEIIEEEGLGYKRSAVRQFFYSISDLSNLSANEAAKSNATKIHEQLVYGTVPLQDVLAGTFVFGKVPFGIPRELITKEADRAIRGEVRDVAVVGGIASGKSFAALQFAAKLVSAGFQVYWVQDGRKLRSDLDTLAKLPGKVCLIVDGYGRYIDEVRDYVRQRPAGHVMLVTERSASHEVLWPVLKAHLLSSPIPELSLDALTSAEARGLEELVNFAGLWPEDLAGRTSARRVDYITVNLERSLYRLLLEVLRSKKVQQEIETLLAPLKEDPDVRHFFTTAFIVSILGYNFWINDWQSFYRIRNAREILRKYSSHVSHFILIDTASIRPRSGVASLYMLQNYVDDETVCECLSDIYEVALANTYGDSEFEQAGYDLVRYNRIEPLFSDQRKLKTIVRYYELIRPKGGTRNSPDYWLQYGIACTISGSLEVAQTAFDNAYARERARPRPNTTNIDNYYGRFLLSKSAALDDSKEAFDCFKQGVGLLLKQIFRDDNRHYPFKAGRSLSEIAARHFDSWLAKQKATFLGDCKKLLLKAEEWQKRNGVGQPDVGLLIREVKKIIRSIEAAP